MLEDTQKKKKTGWDEALIKSQLRFDTISRDWIIISLRSVFSIILPGQVTLYQRIAKILFLENETIQLNLLIPCNCPQPEEQVEKSPFHHSSAISKSGQLCNGMYNFKT